MSNPLARAFIQNEWNFSRRESSADHQSSSQLHALFVAELLRTVGAFNCFWFYTQLESLIDLNVWSRLLSQPDYRSHLLLHSLLPGEMISGL
jgi:hypothetical protein